MIPLATTRIAVLRIPERDLYAEPYGGDDTETRSVVAQHVRAVIDRPSGREQLEGGEQAIWDFELVCDYTDVDYRDLIRDESTGRDYRVVWVMAYPNDHIEAGLRFVQGEV